jgi:2-polyprenyl-3-methyl-5-hydroxy-6-metoxy-1,4-benzoquinol methylase
MKKIQADCPLCSSESAVVISQRARDGSPLTTILCEGCGLARSHPLPDAQELATFYRENYRLLYKSTYQPKPYHVLRAARAAQDRIRQLGRFLRPGLRVLDVGSGGGEFVYLLRARGYQAAGIEPNIGYAAFARDELGLDVLAGLTDDQNFPAGAFDGITLFHVLEHLPAPVETLSHVAGWLGADGFLAAEVPNIESTCEHPAHRFHAAHLFHFSLPTLRRCGELAGLAMVHSETSEDGGNLFAVFRPDPNLVRSREPIPGAFERQFRIENHRAAWRYWTSPSTSARTIGRLRRMVYERLAAKRYPSRRAMLDAAAGS